MASQKNVKISVGWKSWTETQLCGLEVRWLPAQGFRARPILTDDHDLRIDIAARLRPRRHAIPFEYSAVKIAYAGIAIEAGVLPLLCQLEQSVAFHGIEYEEVRLKNTE